MTGDDSRDRGRTWFVLTGAAVGLATGILLSVATDVPFAPEAGLLLGALGGWFWAPVSAASRGLSSQRAERPIYLSCYQTERQARN
jgi:hypothetical protein